MRKYWFSPNIVINGILWLVGLAMQIGGWVNQIFAYTLLGIALFWSICTIIYWVKNKDRIIQEYKEKDYFGVISILQKMDERIRNIVKEEARKAIDFKEYEKVINIINKDILKDSLNITIPKPTTIKGLKKSAHKLATSIEESLKGEITSIRAGIKKLEPVSSYLDTKGFGLKQQRENDKKYTHLASKLQYYRNLPLGTGIDDLIRLHITHSEVSANMLLVTIRGMQVKVKDTGIGFGDVIPTQMQVTREQAENNMNSVASKIRARIGECIRELEIARPFVIVETVNDSGNYYLNVKNIGVIGNFKAQIEILSGDKNLPNKTYYGYWEYAKGKEAQICNGLTDKVKIACLFIAPWNDAQLMRLHLYSFESGEEPYIISSGYSTKQFQLSNGSEAAVFQGLDTTFTVPRDNRKPEYTLRVTISAEEGLSEGMPQTREYKLELDGLKELRTTQK